MKIEWVSDKVTYWVVLDSLKSKRLPDFEFHQTTSLTKSVFWLVFRSHISSSSLEYPSSSYFFDPSALISTMSKSYQIAYFAKKVWESQLYHLNWVNSYWQILVFVVVILGCLSIPPGLRLRILANATADEDWWLFEILLWSHYIAQSKRWGHHPIKHKISNIQCLIFVTITHNQKGGGITSFIQIFPIKHYKVKH